MKLVPFNSYAFRKKKFVSQNIITPIIMQHRVKNGYSNYYTCDCDKHTLKNELITAYMADFLSLNFPNSFSDIKLYRNYHNSKDELPLDVVSDIDMIELMINPAKRESFINFNEERFAAAIDQFVIESIKRSFLVEVLQIETNKKFILYNKSVVGKNVMRPMDTIESLLHHIDVDSAHHALRILYEKTNIRCVKTVERIDDVIIL